jgi:hypothetical protein
VGYSTFKEAPKAVITGDQIGPGQITLAHLDPGLFQAIQSIGLHNHSGAKSRRVNLKDLEGAFGIQGFYMFDDTGTHRYHITIHSGVLTTTEG